MGRRPGLYIYPDLDCRILTTSFVLAVSEGEWLPKEKQEERL